MKNRILLLVTGLLVFSVPAFAHDEAPPPPLVAFDLFPIPPEAVQYPSDSRALRPNLSVFRIDWRAFMSSAAGERYAMVTVSHPNANPVNLDTHDVVATFADGTRVRAINIQGDRSVDGRATLLLSFGRHLFPIVQVETRN